MLVGAAIGAHTGFVLRSRWAMLVAQVTTFFGVLVLVLGRRFRTFVQLIPMLVGAPAGAGLGAVVPGQVSSTGR
jgi:hypothetical protein